MKNKLLTIYNGFNTEYKVAGKVNQDKIHAEISDIVKQIAGLSKGLERVTNEQTKKEISGKIKQLQLKKQNLEGFSKYSNQIDKILQYKEGFFRKIQELESHKSIIEGNIKSKNEELETAKNKLKELNDKYADEEYTKKLFDKEYYELKQSVKQAREQVQSISNEIAKLELDKTKTTKRIESIKGKLGKCDLAWKTLFTNKGWDEIQKRSIEPSEKLTKKTEGAIKTEKEDKTKSEEQAKQEIASEDKTNATSSLTIAPKKSVFTRMKNFFGGAIGKIKSLFKSNNQTKEQDTPQQQADDFTSDVVKDVNASIEMEKSKDKFIEGLRIFVDEDYRKQQNAQKEQAYIDKHSKKKVQNKQEEKEI